ncbi:diguanylate cyclase (GGDEF) domain protein [Lelliottia jeotgali]|nr:diguanylate cyclase (GGDEF) domain protein [Lelliottia jeotgali]
MITSLNFRRPLNICFSALSFTLVIVCFLITLAQWADIKESCKRQNRLYINNVTLFFNKYLSGYENIVNEMARTAADQHKFNPNENDDLALRNWLIERLRIMPDAVSIIHADNDGHFIRLPHLESHQEKGATWDPRKEPWFTIAVEDTDSAHYSVTKDIFTGKERVLTISLPVINGMDGSNNGVLAINLDVEKSEEILNSTYPPMKSRTFVMTKEGQMVISPGYKIADSTLKAIASNASAFRGDFYRNGFYYFYRTIGPQEWFVVQEVAESEMKQLVRHGSIKVLYGMVLTQVILLFCWWALRAALNTIYMRITNGIRNGSIKQTAVEELLFDEIHSAQQRQEKISQDALTDGLTGLANRRAFDTDAEHYNALPNTHIAMIDIDNFKIINDTWGHTVGDVVLKATAELGLRLRGLENITLYRYGGEEIAVLFQDISQEKAQSYLEKWRISLNTRSFRESDLRVSFSAGICKMGGDSLSDVVAKADRLLYQAKKSGKNRILAS